MKSFRALAIIFVISTSALAQSDPWAALHIFEGKWVGATSGKPGKGSTSREYRLELNGKFLYQRDRSVYRTEGASAKPLIHEDIGFFSFDTEKRRIIWRQFHSEGYVNEYVLNSVSDDGKSLEFVTTRIENLPGFRAKKIYRVLSADEIEETFLLAPPGKDFEPYTVSRLKRTAGPDSVGGRLTAAH